MKQYIKIIVLSVIILCLIEVAYGYTDSINTNKDFSRDTGSQQTLSITFRSDMNSRGMVWFDGNDDRIYIDGCSRYYYDNISFINRTLNTVKLSYVLYEPRDYTLRYGINATNGSLLYNDTIVIHGLGFSYNATNLTKNGSNCAVYFVPKRTQRYGFNASSNIPLERLRNHTKNPTPTIKIGTSMNVSFINNTVFVENNTKNTTNITIHVFNSEELHNNDLVQNNTFKDLPIFILLIIVFGTISIIVFYVIVKRMER